jgi:hypothetical protein
LIIHPAYGNPYQESGLSASARQKHPGNVLTNYLISDIAVGLLPARPWSQCMKLSLVFGTQWNIKDVKNGQL